MNIASELIIKHNLFLLDDFTGMRSIYVFQITNKEDFACSNDCLQRYCPDEDHSLLYVRKFMISISFDVSLF